DEHADAAAAVDVRDDGALGRLAARLLRRLRQALRTQVVDRLVHVAGDFDERLLAVRHAGAGALAQVLDHGRGDFHGLLLVRRGRGLGVEHAAARRHLDARAVATGRHVDDLLAGLLALLATVARGLLVDLRAEDGGVGDLRREQLD